jgi:hypothetical protein
MEKGAGMISHSIELVGFNKPLIEDRELRRGLRLAAVAIKRKVIADIKAGHHDTGQLEESLRPGAPDLKDKSITIVFAGIRTRDKRKKKRSNRAVAYFLDKMTAALAKARYSQEAIAAFLEGLGKE